MSFWQILKRDFTEPLRQDPACNSVFEIFFCYPGVWALINYRFAHFFYERGFKLIARAISGLTRIITAVDINPGARIGSGVFFDHATGLVKIGANSVVVKDVAPNCTAVGVPARILGGCESDPLAHNKIPDISQELIKYLIKRIEILEECICSGRKDIAAMDEDLNKFYEEYLKSLK